MNAPHGSASSSPSRESRETAPLAALEHGVPFADRHIGPDARGLARMLETVGVGSLEELADRAMPTSIRTDPADWSDDPTGAAPPPPATEAQVLDELRALAARNTTLEPMLGLGYHGTITPPVIRRNVLEDPAWYTAYTPYQPEISQGRLEALLNFQTMVCDLTGLDVAGASMLDESTAAAEAMLLLRRADKTKSSRFLIDADTLPQTIAVLHTRAESLGIELQTVDVTTELPTDDFFGLLLAALYLFLSPPAYTATSVVVLRPVVENPFTYPSSGADRTVNMNVENGIATSNQLGSDRVIFPVQIIGDQDGMWNKTAWQTEAFYGNPLKGFSALP